jgi:hypothetical protein
VTCGNPKCGITWELQRAHVIKTERTPEGCREIVQCPACGRMQSVTRPDIDECNGD